MKITEPARDDGLTGDDVQRIRDLINLTVPSNDAFVPSEKQIRRIGRRDRIVINGFPSCEAAHAALTALHAEGLNMMFDGEASPEAGNEGEFDRSKNSHCREQKNGKWRAVVELYGERIWRRI